MLERGSAAMTNLGTLMMPLPLVPSSDPTKYREEFSTILMSRSDREKRMFFFEGGLDGSGDGAPQELHILSMHLFISL